MKKKFNWPLCADVFTFWDKVKISKFLFKERIWTYGEWVARYESMWEQVLGGKTHAIMVSSGSTANELIALRRKWELQRDGQWPARNKVIFPVNTWISSVSPWIHAGFEPVFVDVDERNLNTTSSLIEKAFKENTTGTSLNPIGTVFYTALLGFFGDVNQCKEVTERYVARFLMDNCEASFSSMELDYDGWNTYNLSLLNFVTCSTSIFYSHFTTSGTEGGLIFTQDEEERDWFKMMRSHGLTRGMPEKYKNKNVHPSFDFALLGSNYRSSNLQAFMASLDLERAWKGASRRSWAYHAFMDELESYKKDSNFEYFHQPYESKGSVIPLAIPIICKSRDTLIKVETYCKLNGVETRPIIGGCLLAHTAFKGYGDISKFPVAMEAHEKGLYIGLNQDITVDMARELARELKKL